MALAVAAEDTARTTAALQVVVALSAAAKAKDGNMAEPERFVLPAGAPEAKVAT